VLSEIHHANSDFFFTRAKEADILIIPYRLDEESRQASAKRRGGPFSISFNKQIECRMRIFDVNKPRYMICFEEILRTGGKSLNDLLKAIGIKTIPFPTEQHEVIDHGRILTEEERKQYRNEM